MKTKRHCEKINFSIYDYQKQNFEKNYAALKYLKAILSATEGIKQINLLKEIEHYLLQNDIIEDELALVTDTLCTMFYQASFKSAHKKALIKIIQEISKKYPLIVADYLHKHLKQVINSYSQNIIVEEIEKSVLHIICLIDNLTLGKKIVDENSNEVWIYISLILQAVIQQLKQESSLQKKNDWFSLCQSILKLVSHIIQNCDNLNSCLKCNSDKKFQAASEDIVISLEYLLTSDDTKLNCRLNAAFAYCNYSHIAFGVERLNDILIESVKFSVSARLCVYSSIMAVLPVAEFINEAEGSTIADKILHSILEISKISYSSEVLVQCARSILQWTNVILNILKKDSSTEKNLTSRIFYLFSGDKKFMKMLFEYVLHIRDHFIDSLRHLSKDIFQNILNLHTLSSRTEPKKSILLKEMTHYLLNDLPAYNRGKYGMLRCIVEKIGTETILEWNSSLPSELYKVLEEHSLVSHVSELYHVLFSCSLNTVDDDHFQKVWLVPLLEVISSGSKEQTSAVTEHILPKLLDVKPSVLIFLLSELSSMWEKGIGNSFCALVTCMKLHQKQNGALSYLEFTSNDNLMKAFFHADDQVRLSAFSLICENYKTTETIDSNTLEIIKCALPYNINCQCPPFRQQFISYMKKFFTRISESGYAMMRTHNYCKIGDLKSQKVLLPDFYQEFLHWLKNYLFSCLNPGANFPRRVTSLNLLYILHEIFSESIPIVDSEISVHTLMYILQDTYDNNRNLALKLLASEFSPRLNNQDEEFFNSALILACSTKPPDTATAAYLFAYIVQCPKSFQHILRNKLSLLSQDSTLSLTIQDISDPTYNFHLSTIALLMYELDKQLQLAKKNLLEAAACAPLYGILTCIRSILNNANIFFETFCIQWQQLIKELISLSFNIVFVVEPIVCNSSPEGHLPMDTDTESITQLQTAVRKALGSRFQSAVVVKQPSKEPDVVTLDVVKSHAVTSQLLLLCCWRTHREVSLLFGDLAEKMPLFDPNIESSSGILCVDQIINIGTYFLHQMSLVKHRGAFEQAQIGLSKLCYRLWRCNIEQLNELPKKWLEDMVLAIKGLKEEIQLCPTRRSAGLPFIIQAIVSSEPSICNSQFFKNTLLTFLDLAQPSQNYNTDVQVHALNILRTLFRDASLGESVMPFVSEGLKISITGFKSHFWAVRNSSTLLFSALMTRMFGVNRSHDETGKKNRLSGKSFYSYYKNLYIFLCSEIKQCAKSLVENKDSGTFIEPSLYPILLLLVRLYPAPGEEDTILSAFVPYLRICASSPIWKTRKLAAKTLVAFTPREKVLLNIESLMKELDSAAHLIQNEVHGKLLQVLYYMEEINSLFDFEKNSLKNMFESSFSCFDLYIKNNKCTSTKAAFLQIYFYAITLDIEPDSSTMAKMLHNELLHSCNDPDKDNYIAISIATLILKELQLYSNKMMALDIMTSQSSIAFFKLFKNFHHSVIPFTLIEILLWFLQKDSIDINHYLETSDDIVVVQKVLKIVMLIDKKKYNIRHFLEEHCLTFIFGMLESVTDPSLLRQVYKLLSFMPSSLSAEWKFLKLSHSFELIDKLEHVLNLMEVHSRDDVTCELLMYSSHLIAKLSEEYISVNKEVFFFKQKDIEVIKNWLEKIEECAYPDSSILLRNTVVSILMILVDKSVFPKSSLLGSLNLWQSLLLVLIDDEPDIKYRASEVVMKMKFLQNKGNIISSVVSSKAVDFMMELFVENNYEDPKNCVSMLISWMLFSDMISYESVTDEQPFDKGELNLFSEDLNLTNIVSHHLSAYLSSLNSPKDKLILSGSHFIWNDKTSLTFADIIILCLSEANTAMKKFWTRGAISPLLDAYFYQDLIYISQRLTTAVTLLPFSFIHSDFSILGNELLKQFQNLNFRTFFIEDLISKVQCFLNQLTVSIM